MTVKKSPTVDYFVTFAIMTHNTNPLGHAFLLINQLDHTQKENARVEILDGIGLYSRYMRFLKYKPISRGRVKEEDFKSIVGSEGMYHKTFQVSQQQLELLLADINADRRILGDEKTKIDLNKNSRPMPDKPGGPMFNLFTGNNCKRYILQKLERIGLDVKNLHGFLELPRYTSNVRPLTIEQTQQDGREFIYWNSPLTISDNPHLELTPEQELHRPVLESFYALNFGLDQIINLLKQRENQLHSQGRKVTEISTTLQKLQTLKSEISAIQAYPNRIETTKVTAWCNQIDNIVNDCTNSLKHKNIEEDFVLLLLDTLKEMWYRVRHYFGKNPGECTLNSKDHYLLNQIHKVEQTIRLKV